MSSELKKLQAKWYKKLARSGFEDIEDTSSPNEFLNTWDSLHFLSRYTVDQFHARERYFQLATQFLEEHMFDTSREKSIWAEYCTGLSMRAIARNRRVSLHKIRVVIKKLEEAMLGRRKNKD